jgi:membrane protein implicated in regulation of membrane protease activity
MQKIGAILLLIGIGIFVIFGGAGFLKFLFSPDVPIFVKIAAFSIAGGVLLIIFASLKENWGKTDKYEEVKK